MSYYEEKRDKRIINALEDIAKQLKRLNEPICELATATPADVIEVKHGEWGIGIGYDRNKKFKCSLCELMTYEPTNFCPYCGAKMDGGKI